MAKARLRARADMTKAGRREGPPRLLCVQRYHWRKGGAEAVYLDHLRLFRERGWDCAEFAVQDPRNLPSDWSAYFPTNFEPEGGGGPLGAVGQAARFIHSTEAAERMAALLDDFQPDVVHIHGLYQQLTPSVLDPIRARGIPVVYTAHEYKLICPAYHLYTEKLGVCERCFHGRQWNAAVHACLHDSHAVSAVYALDGLVHWWGGAYRHKLDALVMPSRFILDKHREAGFEGGKLHLIPNFFETTEDQPTDPAAVAELRARFGRYALYFGRLSREKGVESLIRAAAAAGVPLVIAGEGPEEAELRALAGDLGGEVAFLGFLQGAALWAAVEAAAAVCLPSIWYENAPKSILEAQSRGRLCVVAAIGGLPEMVEDGVTGLLHRPGDVDDLAAALRRAMGLTDEDMARMTAEAGRRLAERFTADRYYEATTALYRALTPPGAGPA